MKVQGGLGLSCHLKDKTTVSLCYSFCPEMIPKGWGILSPCSRAVHFREKELRLMLSGVSVDAKNAYILVETLA